MSHLSPDFLESLAEGDTASVEQSLHLESCPDCSRQLRDLRKYFTQMKSLPVLKAPSGFSTRLRQRLETEAALPGWKRFLSALFTIRRIPLQLAGAGFAALLLFWALPRYQNLVPQSETETAKKQSPTSPPIMEDVTIDENESEDTPQAEEKISRPEPPRPPMPSDLAAKKSVARGVGTGSGARSGGAERSVASDKKNLPWSKEGDLGMVEVADASMPDPVKTEMPATSPAPLEDRAEKGASLARKRSAAKPMVAPSKAEADRSPSAPTAMVSGSGSKAESKSKSAEDGAFSLEMEESVQAPRAAMEREAMGTAPTAANSAPPTVDSLLRSLGFKRESRKGRSVQILRLSNSESVPMQIRLRDLGLGKLLILHPLPGDSLEIEIR